MKWYYAMIRLPQISHFPKSLQNFVDNNLFMNFTERFTVNFEVLQNSNIKL